MKKNLLISTAVIALLAAYSCTTTGPAGPEGADTVTAEFQYGVLPGNGYLQTSDAGIDSESSNFSCGGDTTGWVGFDSNKWRMLVKFDLSSIAPSNVTVTSASLVMYVNQSSAVDSSVTVTAYSVSRSWSEGEEVWGDVADTHVSWLYYNGVGNSWLTAGGEYGLTPASNIVNITGNGKYVTFNIDANTVKSWISNPASNHGLILIDSTEAGPVHWVGFATKENIDSSVRPKLIVNYNL